MNEKKLNEELLNEPAEALKDNVVEDDSVAQKIKNEEIVVEDGLEENLVEISTEQQKEVVEKCDTNEVVTDEVIESNEESLPNENETNEVIADEVIDSNAVISLNEDKTEEEKQGESLVPVEVKPKSKKKLIIIGVVLAILIIGYFVSVENTKTNYKKTASNLITSMFEDAVYAENYSSLIHDVWYNTIYKVSDEATNKYVVQDYYKNKIAYKTTLPDYYFNDSFNDSLSNLFASSEYKTAVNYLDLVLNGTGNRMEDLSKVPSGLEDIYEKLSDLYDSYEEILDCAINPTGSIITYTQRINNASSDFLSNYKKAKKYIIE